jgi:maleate cis-trans isomerase
MYAPVDISSEENFVRMCEVGCSNGEKAAQELATAKVDMLCFAFTAGSFFKAPGGMRLAKRKEGGWRPYGDFDRCRAGRRLWV